MKQEQWDEWLENPVTEFLIQYLKASAKEGAEIASDDILNGEIIPELEQAKVGSMCMTLTRISEVSLKEIEDFYEEQRERKQNDSIG